MFNFGILGGSSETPPVPEKLVVWLSGSNRTDSLKRDRINSYDFTIQNCPSDNLLDNLLATVTDLLGNPIWFTYIFAGWGCEYLAPASGSTGHTELLAIDNSGYLFAGSTPNVNEEADFVAWNDNQMFWSASKEQVIIYSEILTGSELAEVQAYL